MAIEPLFENPAGAGDDGKAWRYSHGAGEAELYSPPQLVNVADHGSVTAALAAASPGDTVFVPGGSYSEAGPLVWDPRVTIVGESMDTTRVTITTAGADGITITGGVDGPTVMRDIAFLTPLASGSPPAAGSGWGLRANSRCSLTRVLFHGFREGGVLLDGDVADSTNVNLSKLDTVWSLYNGGPGFKATGDNANVIESVSCNALGNRGYGFVDESYLGNTYSNWHTATNLAGPCQVNGGASATVLLNCYNENDQPAAVITSPRAIVIGGQWDMGFTTSAGFLYLHMDTSVNAATFRSDRLQYKSSALGAGSIDFLLTGDSGLVRMIGDTGSIVAGGFEFYENAGGTYDGKIDGALGGLRLLAPKLSFFDVGGPVAKPTVSGSRASGAALTSLLTALASLGLITDSSSA